MQAAGIRFHIAPDGRTSALTAFAFPKGGFGAGTIEINDIVFAGVGVEVW